MGEARLRALKHLIVSAILLNVSVGMGEARLRALKHNIDK